MRPQKNSSSYFYLRLSIVDYLTMFSIRNVPSLHNFNCNADFHPDSLPLNFEAIINAFINFIPVKTLRDYFPFAFTLIFFFFWNAIIRGTRKSIIEPKIFPGFSMSRDITETGYAIFTTVHHFRRDETIGNI